MSMHFKQYLILIINVKNVVHADEHTADTFIIKCNIFLYATFILL
jgi:hypothetical protein